MDTPTDSPPQVQLRNRLIQKKKDAEERAESDPRKKEESGKVDSSRLRLLASNPYVSKAVQTLQEFSPYIQKGRELCLHYYPIVLPYILSFVQFCQDLWTKLEPYHPEEWVPAIFGLFMCFFGGFYFTTFAAIEAYRVCGWETTVEGLWIIKEDLKKVLEANTEDDDLDEDGNGIPDVEEIDAQALIMRKAHLVLITINPMRVSDALSGISTGFMAVIATLRIEFAQTVTMGVTIGSMVQTALSNFVEPLLFVFLPPEYQRWIPVVTIYGSRMIGISIAWLVQRFISAFYSSFRGANLFASSALHYCRRHGYGDFDEKAPVFTGVILALGAIGFLWQVFSGFSLPFPLNLLFFPVTIVEWFLTYMVAN